VKVRLGPHRRSNTTTHGCGCALAHRYPKTFEIAQFGAAENKIGLRNKRFYIHRSGDDLPTFRIPKDAQSF
jgi:hypothetical protein